MLAFRRELRHFLVVYHDELLPQALGGVERNRSVRRPDRRHVEEKIEDDIEAVQHILIRTLMRKKRAHTQKRKLGNQNLFELA